MLEPYDDDLALRTEHSGATPIEVVLRPFDVPTAPDVVWTSDDGQVRVLAVAVHHEPVPEAVAYRIETPDAIVVISGDTRVCSEVEQLSVGADVLVHEACRASAMQPLIAGTVFESDLQLPRRYRRARQRWLRVPACRTSSSPTSSLRRRRPATPRRSSQDLRHGGYQGRITVGEDLTTISL